MDILRNFVRVKRVFSSNCWICSFIEDYTKLVWRDMDCLRVILTKRSIFSKGYRQIVVVAFFVILPLDNIKDLRKNNICVYCFG